MDTICVVIDLYTNVPSFHPDFCFQKQEIRFAMSKTKLSKPLMNSPKRKKSSSSIHEEDRMETKPKKKKRMEVEVSAISIL